MLKFSKKLRQKRTTMNLSKTIRSMPLNPFIKSLVFITFTLCQTLAIAQTDRADKFLPPIINLILEGNQCPSVTQASTITGDQFISSQTQLNALENVSKIDGQLIIDDSGVTPLNFSSLDSLVEITGNLTFNTQVTTNIKGFNCLMSIGDSLPPFQGSLNINSNLSLTNIDGFSALRFIGGSINITNNNALISITDFNSLNNIGESLNISNNDALTNIPNFVSLASIGRDLLITNNDSLNNISGLTNLISIDRNLVITNNNSLSNISGFQALDSLNGNLQIENNDALIDNPELSGLTNLGGSLVLENNNAANSPLFPNLISIGTDLIIRNNDNDSLAAIPEFSSLTTIGRDLIISDNLFEDLPSFSQLNSIGRTLTINANNELENIPAFNALTNVGLNLSIGDNEKIINITEFNACLLYTSPSPRDLSTSRMPSSA